MGNELFKELIKKRDQKRQTEFWDSKTTGRPYGELNAIDIDAIKADNAEKLHAIQVEQFKQEISKPNSRLKKAQDFLNSLPKHKVQITDKIEEKSVNEILNAITKIINSPYKSGDKATKEMTDKAKKLEDLLKSINVNKPLPSTMRKVLEGNTDISIKKYTQEKSDFFEEIVTEYINNLKVKGLKNGYIAITTGKQHKFNLKESNPQLITDVFVFLNDPQERIKGVAIPFSPGKEIKKENGIVINSDIPSFINQLNKMTGSSGLRVAIDNELETCMNEFSRLKIQVKSGINQSILNRSMIRNSIELKAFGDRKLNLLSEVYNLDSIKNYPYFLKDASPAPKILTAYSNYLLSKNIAQTSVIEKNDVYVTERGFETGLDYLNRNDKMHLRFVWGTRLTSNLLTQTRRYQFYQNYYGKTLPKK